MIFVLLPLYILIFLANILLIIIRECFGPVFSWMKFPYICLRKKGTLDIKLRKQLLQEEQATFLIECFIENVPQFFYQLYLNIQLNGWNFTTFQWFSLLTSIVGLYCEINFAMNIYKKGMVTTYLNDPMTIKIEKLYVDPNVTDDIYMEFIFENGHLINKWHKLAVKEKAKILK